MTMPTRPHSQDDDWLEQSLRTSRPAPLADDGFSERVLRSLPPLDAHTQWREALERRRLLDRRFLWLTGGGVVAGALAASVTVQWPDTQQLATAVLALLVDHRGQSGAAVMPWVMTLLCAGLLAFATADSLEPR